MCQYVLEFQYIFRIDELTEFIMEFNCSYVAQIWWSNVVIIYCISSLFTSTFIQVYFNFYIGTYTILYHYNVGSSHSLAITLALLQAVCSLSEKYTDTKPRHLF